MFNKKNSRNHHQVDGTTRYKTSSNNGIESQSKFFGTKIRAFSEAKA